MVLALDKDTKLIAAIDKLRLRIGDNSFVIADHWKGDLKAVGIASPFNSGILAYISCHGESDDRFGYELEMPASADSDWPYQVVGRGSGLSFDELVEIITGHLKRT